MSRRRWIAHSLLAAAAVALAGCAGTATEPSTEPASPTGPTAATTPPEVSVAIELRPVASMALPGQDEYEGLAERLGRDVFYRDMDGNGSFTDGVELLYVLGDAIVGAGDYASATVVPPPPEYRDQWQVSFTLTPDGAERLSAATADAAGEEIAIVEGDRILSIPTIEEPITSGEGVVVVPSQEEAEAIVGIMLGS